MHVIDRLEPVQINHRNRKTPAVLCTRHRFVKMGKECTPVGKPGQRIKKGQFAVLVGKLDGFSVLNFQIDLGFHQSGKRRVIASDDLDDHQRHHRHIGRNRDIDLVPGGPEMQNERSQNDDDDQKGCWGKMQKAKDTTDHGDRDEIGDMPLLIGVPIAKHLDCPCGEDNADHDGQNADTAQMQHRTGKIICRITQSHPRKSADQTHNPQNGWNINRHPVRCGSVMRESQRDRIGKKKDV